MTTNGSGGPDATHGAGLDRAAYWRQRLQQTSGLRATGQWQYGERYNGWLYRRKAQVLQAALAGVPQGAALDLGSGTGWVVTQLRAAGHTVDGCDISDAAVDDLHSRFPGSRFEQVDLGVDELPFPKQAYDVVTVIDVAYHVLSDEALLRGLTGAARCLLPTGRLFISDRFGSIDERPAEHVHFRSLETYRELAGQAGLRITDRTPLFRWLSRPPATRGWSRLPDAVRGPLEFALENLPTGKEPFLQFAELVPVNSA